MEESEILKKWLIFLGKEYTQKRLAIESGLSEVTISALINGKTKADIETLKKISRAIGIKLSDFWAGPDEYEAKQKSKQSQSIGGTRLKKESPRIEWSENDHIRSDITYMLIHIEDTNDLENIREYVEFKFINAKKKLENSNPKKN